MTYFALPTLRRSGTPSSFTTALGLKSTSLTFLFSARMSKAIAEDKGWTCGLSKNASRPPPAAITPPPMSSAVVKPLSAEAATAACKEERREGRKGHASVVSEFVRACVRASVGA